MKINIANPATAQQKIIETEDETLLRGLYDKRISQDVDGSILGDAWKGYLLRISGGNDKQGFAMMQGVITNKRVRLLLKEGSPLYRTRRTGERKRKSVRGCIVGPDLSVINLVIIRKGEGEIHGLTDKPIPRRLGPKRASHVRKTLGLTSKDDICAHILGRKVEKGGKTYIRRPKIQRLVTPVALARKRRRLAGKVERREKSKIALVEYQKLKAQRAAEIRASRRSTRSSKKN